MAWKAGAPQEPRTIQEWFNYFNRRLADIETAPSGGGRGEWVDVELGPNYQIFDTFTPAWRWLNDGRIELRGRVIRKGGAAVADGDVLIKLPYECAPPNNEQQVPTHVSAVAITNHIGGPGAVRVDIRREAAWTTQPVFDGNGEPVFLPDGSPATEVVSKVEVVLRPSTGFAAWVGLDHVAYDPRLYLDALPPVPYGQQPLVPEVTIVVFQHPDGTIELYPAGVQQPPANVVLANETSDGGSDEFQNVRDPYRLLAPENRAEFRHMGRGGI